MKLGDLFRKLVDEKGDEPGEPVEYKGYRIRPAPRAEGGKFYTAGLIAKDFADGPRKQHFIRADTHASREDACAHAILKARQIIDEQGDNLFVDRS